MKTKLDYIVKKENALIFKAHIDVAFEVEGESYHATGLVIFGEGVYDIEVVNSEGEIIDDSSDIWDLGMELIENVDIRKNLSW